MKINGDEDFMSSWNKYLEFMSKTRKGTHQNEIVYNDHYHIYGCL
jgi:hypothetical protein